MKSRKSRGFVLVTSLIFLFVLSSLAIMAMRGSLFGERIASNDRDQALAREYAEMALRDAERDILGLRFDGVTYCRTTAGVVNCPAPTLTRPAGTRPGSADDAGNFWSATNAVVVDVGTEDGGLGDGPEVQGLYNAAAAVACARPVWSGANWQDAIDPPRTCAGTINAPVPTVAYGTFTGAVFQGVQGVIAPRYLIEVFQASDLGVEGSAKMFFRITAVGFGRTQGRAGRTSVTLQSVFSPL